jgi:hypothetical protein
MDSSILFAAIMEPSDFAFVLRFLALCCVPAPGMLMIKIMQDHRQAPFIFLAASLLLFFSTVATGLHCVCRGKEENQRRVSWPTLFFIYLLATFFVSLAIFFAECASRLRAI